MEVITPSVCRCPQCHPKAEFIELVYTQSQEEIGQAAVRLPDVDGVIMLEFMPNVEELAALQDGAQLRVCVWPRDRADHHLPKMVSVELVERVSTCGAA